MPSDRNLKHLHAPFRAKIEQILREMEQYAAKHCPELTWIVVEGYRTATYQNELYQKGRTRPGNIVTFADGFNKRSNHQSSLAVDIAPKSRTTGRIVWGAAARHWEYLGHLARKHKLKWGGNWKKIKDMPHVEWPTTDKTTYSEARAWQKQVGLT